MSYNVIVSETFKRNTKSLKKKYSSIAADLEALIGSLEKDPLQGTPLGKDCYKIRMSITSKGRGKSGGARVITCVKVVKQNVYLLSVFDKSEKESFSDKELDAMLEAAGLEG